MAVRGAEHKHDFVIDHRGEVFGVLKNLVRSGFAVDVMQRLFFLDRQTVLEVGGRFLMTIIAKYLIRAE